MSEYYMFKSGWTAMTTGGLKQIPLRDAKDVASFYLMNYNEEDLSKLRGRLKTDSIIEKNDDLSMVLGRFVSGELIIRGGSKEVALRSTDSKHAEYVKTILMQLPSPYQSAALNSEQKDAVGEFARFAGKETIKVGDLPKKVYDISSYDDFRNHAPDIYGEMEAIYNKKAKNYMTAINFTTTLPQILPNSQNTDIVLFFDAANIWGVDYDSSLDDNKVKSSIGIGLDWFSPVGPMNFSFAQPITKSSSDVTETFRFNLGTTF